MDGASEESVRSRDFERFLTFVDAVVAIAITLLVLPLVDVAGELHGGESVVRLLDDHQAQLYAFFLSFAVIANLWFTQHRVVRAVVVQDPVVTRLMVAWLLMIVFLPFPTALVAEEGHQPATKILYIGTMMVSSLLLGLMARRIGRTRSIRDSDDVPDPTFSWVTTVIFALALAISLTWPATGYYPLFLLLGTDQLVRSWRHLRRDRPASAHVGE